MTQQETGPSGNETVATPVRPPPPPDPPPPQRFGRYQVKGELGRGGMGIVYRAHDPGLDRIIALKVLGAGFVQDETFRSRFLAEARSMARIEHVNVVKVYDVGEQDGIPFFAMELLEGASLEKTVQERGPLPVPEALELLRQAALGLQAAHAQKIIHRDVKPANLILDAAGRVRVVDFGLAKLPDAGTHTATNAVMGTPHYMSPEQGRGEVPDHRSDIYSLGATLYYFLSGNPPFTGNSSLAIIQRQIHEPLKPIGSVRRGVPEPVRALLERMLAKHPAARPNDYERLIAQINAAVAAPKVVWPGKFLPWFLSTLWNPSQVITSQLVNISARSTLTHLGRWTLLMAVLCDIASRQAHRAVPMMARELSTLAVLALSGWILTRLFGLKTRLDHHWAGEIAASSYMFMLAFPLHHPNAAKTLALVVMVRARWAALGAAGLDPWIPRGLVLAITTILMFAILIPK